MTHSMMDERIHLVAGASNFRDFGTYATSHGPRIVERHLYRAAHLAEVDDTGAAKLAELGIATIIDLRGVEERGRAPSVFVESTPIKLVSTPVEPSMTMNTRALETINFQAFRELMLQNYRNYVTIAAPSFGRAWLAVAEHSDRPLVIHCTAGKDRTGFVVAILHDILGVSRDEILADYETTNRAWDRASARSSVSTVDPTTREAVLIADPDYLRAAFDEIEARHGSVEAFIVAATGDPEIVQRLRRAFLSDTPAAAGAGA